MSNDGFEAWVESANSYVPPLLRERLVAKLGVLFLVVVIVLAIAGSTIYFQTGAALQQDTKQQLTESSHIQAETVEGWNGRMKERTWFMTHADEVKTGDFNRVTPFLKNQKESMPDHVAAIHYIDAKSGEILASTSNDAVGTTLVGSDAPISEATLDEAGHAGGSGENHPEHQVVHTSPYQDEQVGGPAIAYVSTIDGQNRAIVVVTDLQARSKALRRPLGEETWTHVVNSEGVVVLSHRTGKIGGQNMGGPGVDSMAVKRGLKGQSGYVEMRMRGTKVSMGYAPVPGTDWVIMTHIRTTEAFALQRSILGSIAGLVAIAFLALGVVALTIGRSTAQALETLAGKARDLEEGDLEVELETTRTDEIGRLYDSFDSMRDSLREQIEQAQQAREEAEQAREEAEALNEHLESKAEAYKHVMQDCAEGDLTRRMDPESESDAMRAIAESFNGMIDQLEAITHQLKGFAEDVAASSEEVTASSEQIKSSSDQVADSVQEISDGAERQNESLQSVTAEMNSLSTTIQQIAASADQVAEVAEQTAETGDEAREDAEEAVEEMEAVEREADATVEAIERLQEQMEQIEEITEFITDIAEQTNILALNASIEAARAGEAGEGFAVVADEVKDLAEDTRAAAADIEELIESVRSQTETTAEEVQQTSREVARSTEIVEQTVDALQEIARFAQETNTGIQEISEATSDQASSTNQAVGMVDEAAAIAERTADEASAAAGATEEQAAALSQMTENATELASEADRLRESLDQFETSGEVVRTLEPDMDAIEMDMDAVEPDMDD